MKRVKRTLIYLLVIAAVPVAATLYSRTATVMAESAPGKASCIIIDPGHGGVDGGAVSCTGRPESSYNLEISLRLNDLLHLLGYDTKMIRTTDISVYTTGDTIAGKKASDLKERVRIANETDNAIYLSIHQNSFPDSRYSGAQVFYPDTQGSQELARQIQSAMERGLGEKGSRECKRASGVYLMEHIRCTGVLIECGFLSNPGEEALLSSPDYQRRLCCMIAAAAAGYLADIPYPNT